MLLKICLILALITGLGAIGVGFLKVEPRIKQAETDRDKNAADLAAETEAKGQVQKKLTTSEANLKKTTADLAQTKTDLQAKTAEADEAGKKVNDLNGQLTAKQSELEKAKAENTAFFELGKSVDQIKKAFVDLKNTTEERNVYLSEKKILEIEINRLKNKILTLQRPSVAPELPKGLTGKIVAVDPKYEFVVLDIGGRQGLLQFGEMIINRDGQMIGKVQITNVEPNYAIANIMKDGRRGEVIEGDSVISKQ